MTADWESAKEIFVAALELPAGQRDSFVQTASNGDAETMRLVQELLRADGESGSFLDPGWLATAFAPPASISPGDRICGRYRVVRLVAEGGMGRVYEAHDEELNTRIALKAIHPEIASVPGAPARFRQEVRIAHRITHPNVCRTFHMDRETRRDPSGAVTEETVFLTMEYLEGESLAQRLRTLGRLPLAETIEIARQLAAALDAAHALGVVHRDIKPANVMLVPPQPGGNEAERAVITDFGLARADILGAGDRSSISVAGAAMGTLAYMAPEQIQGAAVSPATDVYAFGLLLFEMVTGRKAFPGPQTVVAAMQRVSRPAPSARSMFPELPLAWDGAIRACLQIEPLDRPASAAEVVHILEGGRAAPRKRQRRLAAWRPRWPAVGKVLLGSLAAVALFGLVLRYVVHKADSHVAAGALVYLAPVANQTGEAELNNVTQLIEAGLAQSGQINLLDGGRVGDILQQMTKAPDTPITPAIAREIAMRSGAVRVVFADITRTSQGYKLAVDIQQPDNTPARYRNHWTQSWTWQSSHQASTDVSPDLLQAVRESSNWVRSKLGETANDIARLDAPPEDVTTSNWQALAEFANAERLVAAHRRDDAIVSLQDAVKLDPTFALAYARLGDLLASQSNQAESLRAYQQALSSEPERRLTRHERDRIRGLYALDTWDYATAESVFRDSTIYYDSDYLGWFYRASALLALDRLPEAIACMERAAELNPASASAQATLGLFRLMAGDMKGTESNIAKLHSLDEGEALFLEAERDYLTSRYDEAVAKLGAIEGISGSSFTAQGTTDLAHLQTELGRYADALATLTRGMELDGKAGRTGQRAQKQLDRASMECSQKSFSACIADASQALQADDSFKASRIAATILGEAASIAPPYLQVQMRTLLIQIESSLPKGDFGLISEIVRAQVHGERLLAEGRPHDAVEWLRRADRLDAPAELHLALARGLEREAAQDKSARKAILNTEAAQLYRRMAARQAYIWYRDSWYQSGTYADVLEAWLRLLPEDASVDVAQRQEAELALKKLASLRPQEFSRSADWQRKATYWSH